MPSRTETLTLSDEAEPLLREKNNAEARIVLAKSKLSKKTISPCVDTDAEIISYIEPYSETFLNLRLVSTLLHDIVAYDLQKLFLLKSLLKLDWIDHPITIRRGIKLATLPALAAENNLHLVRDNRPLQPQDLIGCYNELSEKALELQRNANFSVNNANSVKLAAIALCLACVAAGLFTITNSYPTLKGSKSDLSCGDVINEVRLVCGYRSSCQTISLADIVSTWLEANKPKINTTSALQIFCDGLSGYCGGSLSSILKGTMVNAEIGTLISCDAETWMWLAIIEIIAVSCSILFALGSARSARKHLQYKSASSLETGLRLFEPAAPTADTRVVEIGVQNDAQNELRAE